jgi:hypothetical protein
MNHPAALAPVDLERLTGYQRQADLEKWCLANGVRYFRGKAGIWTTLDAVNAALGLATKGPPAPAPAPPATKPNWGALQ